MLVETSAPTLVAEGTRLQGSMTFFSGAGVYGIVEGDLIQQSLEWLQVGKSGWVYGSISSQGPVLIEGRVDGDVKSHTKVCLSATASVSGRLIAPKVEIRPGAIFEGELVMESESQSAHKPDTKRAA